MKRVFGLAACLLVILTSAVLAADPAPRPNPATVAQQRVDQMPAHNLYLDRANRSDIDVLFLGDSNIQNWREAGKSVWLERFRGMKAANFGIAGDRVENVLWRVENGIFINCQPRLVVLLVGAGNAKVLTKEQVAEGMAGLVKRILDLSPQSRILLLGLFPRGATSADPLRSQAAEINALLAKLDDGNKVFFLDIGPSFLQPDGTISKEVMPDFAGLSTAGYKIWADAMQAKLTELLN